MMDEREKTDLMVQVLSEGVRHVYGEHRTVHQLERQPFHGSSSFSTERVRVQLDSGEWLDVFFKDLNPDGMLDEAKTIRESGLERSRREFLMYRNLLERLQLDTPKLYGCRWDPDKNLYWLFLENTGPKRLSRLGDFFLWVDAARWVARLHAIDPNDIKNQADFLPHYDANHFLDCAQCIERSLAKFGDQQPLVSMALERYYGMLDELCALPQHLIHGEYFGKNIMIRPESTDHAIAVIDWETAAFGPRGIDIASITAGRWTPKQRATMCNAYIAQLEAETGQEVDTDAFATEIEQVALYRTLWWLGYWSRGDAEHIQRWMKELAMVMDPASTCAYCSGNMGGYRDG